MTVIVEESVCWDCKGKSTCQRLKRLNPGKSIRDEIENLYEKAKVGELDTAGLLYKINGEYRKRGKEIFEILIVNCTLKNNYNGEKHFVGEVKEHSESRYLYYCTICKRMHGEGSDIGKKHKELMDKEIATNETKRKS